MEVGDVDCLMNLTQGALWHNPRASEGEDRLPWRQYIPQPVQYTHENVNRMMRDGAFSGYGVRGQGLQMAGVFKTGRRGHFSVFIPIEKMCAEPV